MLHALQKALPLVWGIDGYSSAFQASTVAHKDFAHAALHVTKALGKLASMIEEADHKGAGALDLHFPRETVRKYLADIVICVTRMAITNPTGPVDLEAAVTLRFAEKMGKPLKT